MKYTCSMETVQQNGRFTLFSSKFLSICSILYGCSILFILVPWSLQKTLIFLSLILPRCTFRIYFSAPLYMCKELVLDITTTFRKNDFLTSWMCDRKPVFMKSKSNNLLTKAKKEVSSKYIDKGILKSCLETEDSEILKIHW